MYMAGIQIIEHECEHSTNGLILLLCGRARYMYTSEDGELNIHSNTQCILSAAQLSTQSTQWLALDPSLQGC